MVERLKDAIDSIMMYASEPLKPSNIRVFDIKPEMWEWLKAESQAAEDLLHGWKRILHPDLRTPLPEGTAHEPVEVSPVDPRGADADGVR